MKKTVLFVATVDYHFSAFHLPYLKWFKEQGWDVHVAAAGSKKLPYADEKYSIPIQRSPFNRRNMKAYKELKEIIDENQYNIIHCHTPMGGVLARLASWNARKHDTKVIYTAHGFHFCKGAPLLNWLVYYPIEKILARQTDCLITINQEDFSLATNHKFKAKKIEHIHGVGVDAERFNQVNELYKLQLREKYHYGNDTFLMFYAAEFNKNKNQKFLIEVVSLLKERLPKMKLLLAGDGPLLEYCKELSRKLGVEEMVDFLGYRKDIESLLKLSDIAVASSVREGLPVNILEAMACGLPVVAVDNRGHRELIINDENGWVVGKNPVEFAEKVFKLSRNQQLREQFGLQSREFILKKYSVTKILDENSKMYKNVMKEMEEVQWAAH